MALLVFILSMIPSILCIITSAILCMKERDGWGWFLFVGLLLAGGAMSGSDIIGITGP